MPSRDQVLKAYKFFMNRSKSKLPFSIADLATATGWKESTIKTYISKQYRDFLAKQQVGVYLVLPEFQRFSEEDFLQLATQKRRVFTPYKRMKYRETITYEFLLPLTREDQLRKALDALFYKDTIMQRLSEIDVTHLDKWIGRREDESEEEYLGRLCKFVSHKFYGYSISHVSGRFRAAELQTRKLAAEMLAADERYIIDETTASVRFIVPIEATRVTADSEIHEIDLHDGEPLSVVIDEISLVHALFFSLFVEAIVRMVDGEDEIWLLEDVGNCHSLYVWERA